MDAYNWTSFKVRINIKATIAAVYEMWATSAGIEKWFLRHCEVTNDKDQAKAVDDFISKGDRFLWRWHGYPDDILQRGEVLEANGADQLSFTFGQEGAEDMACIVKVYAEDGENICEIIQHNIPENEKGKSYYHIGCITGWTFFLTNLKSILEGGIDLRNKNERLQKMLNA